MGLTLTMTRHEEDLWDSAGLLVGCSGEQKTALSLKLREASREAEKLLPDLYMNNMERRDSLFMSSLFPLVVGISKIEPDFSVELLSRELYGYLTQERIAELDKRIFFYSKSEETSLVIAFKDYFLRLIGITRETKIRDGYVIGVITKKRSLAWSKAHSRLE